MKFFARSVFALTFGCVLVVFCGCSTFPPEPKKTILAADRVELPTVKKGHCLFVDVKINGAGPFRLIVDTGADGLYLAADAAAKAGLQRMAFSTHDVQGVEGRVKGFAVKVARLESGGFLLEDIVARVVADADLAPVRRAYGQIDGALGMAAVKDVVLELDFPHGQVAVARPGTQRYAEQTAELTTRASGEAQVVLSLNGKPTPLLFDTGADDVLLIPDLDAVPLLFPKIKMDGVGSAGIGTSPGRRQETGQLADDVAFGPVVLRNAPVSNGDRMGAGALMNLRLALDQTTHRIYFLVDHGVSEWKPAKPLEPSLRSGYFGVMEGNGVRLMEVDAGGVFDRAGLRPGDVVYKADDASAPAPGKNVSSPPQQKFRVKRDGREFDVWLRMRPETSNK